MTKITIKRVSLALYHISRNELSFFFLCINDIPSHLGISIYGVPTAFCSVYHGLDFLNTLV